MMPKNLRRMPGARCILLVFYFFIFSQPPQAQVIYISTASNAIYRLTIDDCSYTFVTQVERQIYDIAFHPNGPLYGISGNGNLFRIDTLTGITTILHTFQGQTYNSLTIGSDGLVYTIGNEGELWRYNLLNDSATYLGDIGYDATGDLAFYKGQLYAAVTGDRIVRINLNSVSNSTVIINDDISGNILGIVSDVVDCTEINCYAISNGLSDIYQINFETNSLQLICQLNITVGGGASTSEFLASSPLQIDTLILVQPDCKNENGQAQFQANGGSGSYSYSLNGAPFQPSGLFTSLTSGVYTAVVIDQLGCEDTISFELSEPIAPQIDTVISQPTICGMNNGTIEILGSGLYFYSLDSIVFQSSPLFTNLGPGPYTVFANDSSGCPVSEVAFIDSLPSASILQVDLHDLICGDVFPGSLQIISDPTDDILYSIDGVEFQSGNSFGNLGIGTYLTTIIDANGCQDTMTAELLIQSSPEITTVSTLPEHCGNEDGSMIISVHEGTGPYQYSLDGFSYQTSNTFTNLSAGNYFVYILDNEGCSTGAPIIIESLGYIQITAIESKPTDCGQATGSIRLSIDSDATPYMISLNGMAQQSEALFTNLGAGSYQVHVISDAGCEADTVINLAQSGCKIYIPNIFSPNGDGINDLFQIRGDDSENIMITRFFIFDRWGNNVYKRYNLSVLSNEGWWDGTFKRFTASPGVFAYFLEVEYESGLKETYKGDVTLMR